MTKVGSATGLLRLGRALPLLALMLSLGALAALAGHPASADTASMLGVDVKPDRNSPSSVSLIDACVSVERGDEFPVDVFVNNVSDLVHWELRIGYDDDVVELQSADYNYFLVSDGSGNVFPTLTDKELDGRYFLAAAEYQGEPDSGSGVLARLTMKAVDEGSTTISVVSSPPYLGPRLEGPSNATVGDSNGDGIWDGSVVGGKVLVGSSCKGNEPLVTPKPSPKPTPEGQTPNAEPSVTLAPGDGGGGGSAPTPTDDPATPEDEGDGDTVAVIGGSDGSGGGDVPGSDPEDATDDEPGAGPDDADTSDGSRPGGREPADDGTSSASASDGGSGFPWIVTLLGGALALAASGLLLYGLTHRRGF